MEFDLSGNDPISKKGEYFRNNVWWWRPLWDYVCIVSGSTLEGDKDKGSYNDGHFINKTKTKIMVRKLKKEIEQGKTAEYEKDYKAYIDSLPMEVCVYCKDTKEDVECNHCHGSKVMRSFFTNYPFTEENVKEFVEFAEDSGGFNIW